MKSKHSYKLLSVLFGLSIVGLVIVLILIYQSEGDRNVYVGSGVYDLTKCVPYSEQGEVVTNKINMLAHDFETNSTRISVVNNGNHDVIVYLYDKRNSAAYDNYIAIMTVAPTKKGYFTMLTQARQYQIGIETKGTGYELLVSD